MKSRSFRLALLAASLVATPLAAASVWDFTWDAQAQPESVGTPRDPADVLRDMGALQKSLAARQVDRGVRQQIVVSLGAEDRKRIDVPGPADGRYLVGVDRPIGVSVDFAAARRAGERSVDLAAGAALGRGDGSFVWTLALRSPGATGLRAHLVGLDLPEGAELYAYNLAGLAFGPYTGRGPLGSGELWTNTVAGEQLLLQLVAPAGTRLPALRVESLGVLGKRFLPAAHERLEALDPAAAAAKTFCSYNAGCVVNASCTSSSAVNAAADAVATMLFTSGGSQYICTGGLIADRDTATVVPYFLTAHHCINKSGEASSLETWFDYVTTCNGPSCAQPYGVVTPDTTGATIVATGSSSDYSLLRLASAPRTPDGVATYLGWNSTDISKTTTQLYRLSHPKGAPQAYSEQKVDPTKGTCRTLPRGSFLYSKDNLGATEGGSSGSPVVNGSGQIVGQLYGACGTNLNDVCDASSNATVDGAFAASYPNLAAWLDPGSGGTCSPAGAACTSNGQCCSNACKGKPGAQTCR